MRILILASNLAKTILLLRRASPAAFYFTIAANLLVGLVPGALVYLGAQLIERLTDGSTVAAALILVIAYVLLSGFQDSLSAISSFVLDTLQDTVRMMVNAEG